MKNASEALISLFDRLEAIREDKGIVLDELCKRLNTGRGSLEKRRRAMRTGNTRALVSSIVEYYHAICPEMNVIVLPLKNSVENIATIDTTIRVRRDSHSRELTRRSMGYKDVSAISSTEYLYMKQSDRGTFDRLWRYGVSVGMDAIAYRV